MLSEDSKKALRGLLAIKRLTGGEPFRPFAEGSPHYLARVVAPPNSLLWIGSNYTHLRMPAGALWYADLLGTEMGDLIRDQIAPRRLSDEEIAMVGEADTLDQIEYALESIVFYDDHFSAFRDLFPAAFQMFFYVKTGTC